MAEVEEPMDDGQGDESGSEYEYDDTETETFYVTLDLSSFGPSQASKPFKPKNSRKASELIPQDQEEQISRPMEGDDAASREQDHDHDNTPAELDTQHKVHVLDLSSKNPIVLYRGQTYSCEWGSTIGTDFLIGRQKRQADDTEDSPSHSPPKAELLGLSTTRLTGRPVHASLRPEISLAVQEASIENTHLHGPSVYDYPSDLQDADADRKNKQASFLERLQSMKAAKGETDTVPMKAPSQLEKQRSTAARSRGRGRGGRPRGGRRAGSSLRERLARDLAVKESDGPGSEQTPDTWDELGRRVRTVPISVTSQNDATINKSDGNKDGGDDSDEEDVEMQDA